MSLCYKPSMASIPSKGTAEAPAVICKSPHDLATLGPYLSDLTFSYSPPSPVLLSYTVFLSPAPISGPHTCCSLCLECCSWGSLVTDHSLLPQALAQYLVSVRAQLGKPSHGEFCTVRGLLQEWDLTWLWGQLDSGSLEWWIWRIRELLPSSEALAQDRTCREIWEAKNIQPL